MQYTHVVAIGDSFTRGDELADCPYDYNLAKNYSHSTWPALLAKELNVKYDARQCVGGIGNDQISWKVIGKVSPTRFYIVNWTWFERFDYLDPETNYWKTTHPRHEENLDHFFYRNIDSDLWNLYRNLQLIHSTIEMLKYNNINFIMTCLEPKYKTQLQHIFHSNFVNTMYGQRWHKVITNLHNQVLPHIIDFDGLTFLEWTKINGWKCGPNGHPLEDAHIAAAEYMLVNKHFG